MKELKGKVILVTGADSGIGKGVAEVCAREGATVIVSSLDAGKSQKVVDMLPHDQRQHTSIKLDVSSNQDCKEGIAFIVQRYGKIDGLVNNAGIDFGRPFLETPLDEWNNVIQTNLSSIFTLSQLVLPHFIKQNTGAIVSISSVHTYATYQGSGPYAASKAAIDALGKSLACEFGRYNIRINCVAPGLVKTGIWKDLVSEFGGSEKDCLAFWRKQIPIQRIIEPIEIGEIVSFLLSERASCMNGSIVYADGGLTSQLITNKDE